MITLAEQLAWQAAQSSQPPSSWPPPPGPPTAPWPQPITYNTTLSFTPPPQPDRRFIRADGWGVTVPGLPFVKGGSSEHPDRLLTAFIQRYSPDWRTKCYAEYLKRGYTHWLLWLADMAIEDQMNPSDVLAIAQEIKQATGCWIRLWLGSKNYPQFIPRDADVWTWQSRIAPYLQPLLALGAVDHVVLGGEFDLWNQGDPNNDMPFRIAQMVVQMCQPFGVDVYFHMSTHVTFWGDVPGTWNGQTINDRFDWTRLMCDVGVRGLDYQGDSAWALNEAQGRVADSLGRVDPRWEINANELLASWQFSGHPVGSDFPTELYAQMWGRGYLCTGASSPHTDAHLMGYGNGAAYANGLVI